MLLTCSQCGEPMPLPARGRTPKFCSTRCRVASHRAHRLPDELTKRTAWTRRDGKRPITCGGRSASTTKRSTWPTSNPVTSFTDAGDGIGVMLGDGLGCYDLDHCLTGGRLASWAADVLKSITPVWVEVSMSGDGIHAFVLADEAPGTRRDGVESYSRERFIAVTGVRYQP